jgi:transcriptional regulator with GAF, ATPase, and Fis domain
MCLLQRIEEVGKTIERLASEIEELKLLASETSPAERQPVPNGGNAADNQLGIVLSYLALSPGVEEDELLNTLLTCAMTVVRAEGAAVTLYDEEKNALIFRAAVGIASERLIGCEVPLGHSQHGIAFRMRQVISSTPMYKVIDEITGADYRNVLAAPLIIDGEPIGTLGAVNKMGEDHFTPQDIEHYSNFADLAAHVIQQRLRENSLKRMVEGEPGKVPPELSTLNILKNEAGLLELTRNIVAIGRKSPELLSLCKQFIDVLTNMA